MGDPKESRGNDVDSESSIIMESIVQLYSTILANSTKAETEDKLDPEKIVLAMRSSWETHQ